VSYQQLWAPWRLDYIQGNKEDLGSSSEGLDFLPGADPKCFLCQSVVDTADRQRYVVHRAPRSITLLNRYPYNNGHLLIAPRCHRGRLDELTPEEQMDLIQGVTRMVGVLERVLKPAGFNIGLNLGEVAGAGLPGHLHWHVVPRWSGDSNFMPAVAAVKVIPQSLDALWEILTGELAKE
jgi:ATP adenylyltransferase